MVPLTFSIRVIGQDSKNCLWTNWPTQIKATKKHCRYDGLYPFQIDPHNVAIRQSFELLPGINLLSWQ